MRRITGRIMLLILSVLNCFFAPRAAAQNAGPDAAAGLRRNVLILYTYSKDLPWRLAIDDGLKSVVGSLPEGSKPFRFEETVDQSRLGMGPADTAT